VPLKQKKKTSPATIPPTPDVPICQRVPTVFIPKANTTAKAPAKDVVPIIAHAAGSEKVVLGGCSTEKEVMPKDVAGISKWKKWTDSLFHLDNLQEKANNQISSTMNSFVQRTIVMKEVCIPYNPRAPWRIINENPLRCS
jgi:hypothetical protein